MSYNYPDDVTPASFDRYWSDKLGPDDDEEPEVGLDICPHGLGFDEVCEDCARRNDGIKA